MNTFAQRPQPTVAPEVQKETATRKSDRTVLAVCVVAVLGALACVVLLVLDLGGPAPFAPTGETEVQAAKQ